MDLDQKVAVVTGSTKGIGEGIAIEMAKQGAKVIVTGRDVENGRRVAAGIQATGGKADFFPADLGEEDQCIGLLNHAVATFGSLNILVNNHAPTVEIMEKAYDKYLADTKTADWDHLIHYGLTSVYYMLKNAIPIMLRFGGGSIVNISSLASVLGVPGLSMYSATKGGMNAMTRNIAVDYGQQGIRCNTIVVGNIMSNPRMDVLYGNPAVKADFGKNLLVTRYGYPSDIAHAAVYFASDKAGYVTGQELRVDGGISMKFAVPSLQQGFADMQAELG